MKKINKITFLLLLTIFASGYVFAGGGSRNGTAGATELLIPVGARGIAMSSATLTNATGVEALYWNPANVARGSENTNVLFSHMNYIADINVEYGAISTNIEGFGALALSIKSLNIGDIPVTTVTNPDGTGQTFSPQYTTVGFTYSRLLSDRIAVGVTTNLVMETLGLVSTTGVAFNIGLSYANLGNVEGLNIAFVLKNIGPQMKYDGSGLYYSAISDELDRPTQLYKVQAASFELPSTLEIGLGYNYNINESNKLILNGVFQNSNFYADEYKVGAEYGYNNTFFVRAGYDYLSEVSADYNIYGLTAGAGVQYNMGGLNVKFDYAYRDVDFFDANHVFTVTLGF